MATPKSKSKRGIACPAQLDSLDDLRSMLESFIVTLCSAEDALGLAIDKLSKDHGDARGVDTLVLVRQEVFYVSNSLVDATDLIDRLNGGQRDTA